VAIVQWRPHFDETDPPRDRVITAYSDAETVAGAREEIQQWAEQLGLVSIPSVQLELAVGPGRARLWGGTCLGADLIRELPKGTPRTRLQRQLRAGSWLSGVVVTCGALLCGIGLLLGDLSIAPAAAMVGGVAAGMGVTMLTTFRAFRRALLTPEEPATAALSPWRERARQVAAAAGEGSVEPSRRPEDDRDPARQLWAVERLAHFEYSNAIWIERYHDGTRRRASQSFWVGTLAAAAGFGLLAWVIWYLVSGRGSAQSTSQLIAVGGLGAVGTLITGYVARTFLELHRMSLKQFDGFFWHPADMHRLLIAWRMAETLGDGEANIGATAIRSIAEVIANLPPRGGEAHRADEPPERQDARATGPARQASRRRLERTQPGP